MRNDFSCGIVPVLFDGHARRYLLVQHNAGHWAFPKGHPEAGETELEAARREFAEETGLENVEVLATAVFDESYVFKKRSGKVVRKNVRYFLGRVPAGPTVKLQEAEVADHAWGVARASGARMSFPEGKQLLKSVEAFINAGHAAELGL